MKKQFKLSICIPTRNRPVILRYTLESILSQKVASTDYEICVSDVSDTDSTYENIKDILTNNINIKYQRIVTKGYLNLLEVLKMGTGDYLKLHNDYSMFKEGSLQDLMLSIQALSSQDSLIFFALKNSLLSQELYCDETFNDFLYRSSYLVTWSTSFGISKVDFDTVIEKIIVDEMFPHVSILFKLTSKKRYYIDNKDYFVNIQLENKGGYNLPDVFGRRFISMIEIIHYLAYIEAKTFSKVKKDVLRFIANWIYNIKLNPKQYQFETTKLRAILIKKFSIKGLLVFYFLYLQIICKSQIKNIIKRFF